MRFLDLDWDRNDSGAVLGRKLGAPVLPIETDVPPDVENRLLAHTAETWKLLGETDAHYSVLTDVGRGGRDDELFDRTGAAQIDIVRSTFARAHRDFDAVRSVVELGCGVGRITRHLAAAVDRVAAIDISAPHLALARQACAPATNVTFELLRSVDQLSAWSKADLFFTVLVLQHNSPPVQKAMLERIFNAINPGGFAYFQIPTYIDRYRFNPEDYLAGGHGSGNQGAGNMEMHALPQGVVFELLRDAGFALLEVQEDGSTGSLQMMSQTFFAQRLSR